MFKKAVILFLSALLVCMAFTVVSSAADACKIGLSYAVDGEILNVTITYSEFTDPDGIIAVSSNVIFDNTVLEFQKVDATLPETWGEQGENWSKLYSDGNVLVCLLFNSGEEDHGTSDPISCTVSFKMLSKNANTLIEVKNNELTEDGELNVLNTPNTSLSVSISESGEVSGEVSEEEPSVPEEDVSEQVSEDASEVPDNSAEDESKPAENSDASSDVSTGNTDGESNWIVWVVVGVAIVAVAAIVTVVVMKKKN